MNQLQYALPVAYEARPKQSGAAALELRSFADPASKLVRPSVHGKFLFVGEEKLWIKGVTYGTFRPDADGYNFPVPSVVRSDMSAMARAGFNSVRVYTVPPRWLLDIAGSFGLRVMVGLPWEQHVAFLDDQSQQRRIIETLRQAVRQCSGHPAVLCYAVGNEIPASVVRWYGRRKIGAFLNELANLIRDEDPGSLVTYVNFPTTEYLDLNFVDFVSFNVYLETREKLSSYLARLQNLAGDRPLLMAEIGLDSRRNGEQAQAETLRWQIKTAYEAGCVGAFLFAWTDEWYRGGFEIDDWDFGLTTRNRKAKLALVSVSRTFALAPFFKRQWPKISVVVCSYNGSSTIGETLAALEMLNYPDYEIIVIDDGSTDNVSLIAQSHRVRLIRQDNQGLSAARNAGLAAATGEIVAYIDDDAYPDVDWLRYLAIGFQSSSHAAIGGPNLCPPGDGHIANCVANAPGGPVHVLLTDTIAEHLPGCNMAFRRHCLAEIGGFDARFRMAGDDVDVCWRLQERGWTLGFSPAALVWHHRRNSIARYLKQQRGYAKAEALLAEKWPQKYNSFGHLTWEGRLYGRGNIKPLLQRARIYHGTWGSALFQSVYEPAPGHLICLSLMPEWYALLLALGAGTGMGLLWQPLLWLTPIFMACLALTLIQAVQGARRANFDSTFRTDACRLCLKGLVASLHLLQPAARLVGRVQHGLGPWSRHRISGSLPKPETVSVWCEQWAASDDRLAEVERILQHGGADVARGGDFDDWDFAVKGGLFGSVRVRSMTEEHGAGRQMFRLRAWPFVPKATVITISLLLGLSGFALLDQSWPAVTAIALASVGIGFCAYRDCAVAARYWADALIAYSKVDR
jgi:glycosyltransferase involved in cell wall biosynthesis